MDPAQNTPKIRRTLRSLALISILMTALLASSLPVFGELLGQAPLLIKVSGVGFGAMAVFLSVRWIALHRSAAKH